MKCGDITKYNRKKRKDEKIGEKGGCGAPFAEPLLWPPTNTHHWRCLQCRKKALERFRD